MTRKRLPTPTPSEAEYWPTPDIFYARGKYWEVAINGHVTRTKKPSREEPECLD